MTHAHEYGEWSEWGEWEDGEDPDGTKYRVRFHHRVCEICGHVDYDHELE
jgi:hypothetical protein